MGDVFIDGSHEFGHAFERPPAQAVEGDWQRQLLEGAADVLVGTTQALTQAGLLSAKP